MYNYRNMCKKCSYYIEKHVRQVHGMKKSRMTVVRCAIVVTDGFKVEVGLHQGLATSSFLFAMVMDRLTGEVRQVSLQRRMFADDKVICRGSREPWKKTWSGVDWKDAE